MRSANRGSWPVLMPLWCLLTFVFARVKRGIWQALTPLCFLLACVFAPGCACEPARQAQSRKTLACRSQHDKRAVFPRRTSQLALMPGKTPVSFGVTDTGESAMTMPLVVPPGRAGVEPSLALSYSSGGSNGVLGLGVSITGASAITRCPKTMAMDGEIRAVDYSANDARCLDGKRLVMSHKTAIRSSTAHSPIRRLRSSNTLRRATNRTLKRSCPRDGLFRTGQTMAVNRAQKMEIRAPGWQLKRGTLVG